MHTLLVTDHGPGIAAADQQHVFTRFWRGDTSRTRHTGGAGLGLAIVSSIVTAHGGTSEVISQVGQGTTIRITLPSAAITVSDLPGPPIGDSHRTAGAAARSRGRPADLTLGSRDRSGIKVIDT